MEEVFGPVVVVHPFDTEEEAIEIANGTEDGLASTIWTQNLERPPGVGRNGYGSRLGQYMAPSRFTNALLVAWKNSESTEKVVITRSTFIAIHRISVFRCPNKPVEKCRGKNKTAIWSLIIILMLQCESFVQYTIHIGE